MNVTAPASFTMEDNTFGYTAGILVTGTMNVSQTSFTRANNNEGIDNTTIHVNSGGHFNVTNSLFALDNIVLNGGSTDTIHYTAFQSQLVINSAATITITSNDFTSSAASVEAAGVSTATINISNNYWGTTNTATIAAKITDHTKDATRPTVVFSPPLSIKPADIVASNASILASAAAQNVTLNAAVLSPSATVNEGTATFTLLNGAATVGTPVTVNVISGAASASRYSATRWSRPSTFIWRSPRRQLRAWR